MIKIEPAKVETEAHQLTEVCDEDRDWNYRPPPRGIKPTDYVLCEASINNKECEYGNACVQSHSVEELQEWKERFDYRKMKYNQILDKRINGKSISDTIMEELYNSSNLKECMKEDIEGIDCYSSKDLNVIVEDKVSTCEWIFTIKSRIPVRGMTLLRDSYRNHFELTKIQIDETEEILKNNQEWVNVNDVCGEYFVEVKFRTDIFGTFRQTVAFDFGEKPYLVKHLSVDVIPKTFMKEFTKLREDIEMSLSKRWNSDTITVISFDEKIYDECDRCLLASYPCPQDALNIVSQAIINEKQFTVNNYRQRMHNLLYLEEVARFKLMSHYNVKAKLDIVSSYLLSPFNMSSCTGRYARDGQIFAAVKLGKHLSEDSAEGRMILMYSDSVLIRPSGTSDENVVFEARIGDRTKNMIYLSLSKKTVEALKLTGGMRLKAHLQFQLNRLPYCRWHHAIDKMFRMEFLFPNLSLDCYIPWTPSLQWSTSNQTLNPKQKEAVIAIATPLTIQLPPILLIGPYGTGKTFTMAQAVKTLLKNPANRILLCTHSNSSADLYIKEYFDKWILEQMPNVKPLRIYYEGRWTSTVDPVVQRYCLVNYAEQQFKKPTLEDIMAHNIIVATLSTSIDLSMKLNLPTPFFTHILIDEAAQAMECEMIIPLIVAAPSTRIVLAGDHLQMGPDIFSPFVKERHFGTSLLERLYHYYPKQFACKIMLCENYRSNDTIISFTSECFYEQKLVASSKQPRHESFYPMTFFAARGEDVQDTNSTAFYNNAEVYEVVERVGELRDSWPTDLWGGYDERSIGVVTPYSDQVHRIRSELRKKGVHDVCVERVHNVQGKQFRVIILSTVRTRKSYQIKDPEEDIELGFLSNTKLLNTAITRAQSLVAVVGDPVALCSLGKCSKVWERFIRISEDNKSLFGMTWSQVKEHLTSIELRAHYPLNPLASPFISQRGANLQQSAPVQPKSQAATPTSASNLPVYTAHHLPPMSVMSLSSLHPQLFPANLYYTTRYYELLSVLPSNMSIAEMLLQPVQYHVQWYHHLVHTMGFVAAEKFKFFIEFSATKGFVHPIMEHPYASPISTRLVRTPANVPLRHSSVTLNTSHRVVPHGNYRFYHPHANGVARQNNSILPCPRPANTSLPQATVKAPLKSPQSTITTTTKLIQTTLSVPSNPVNKPSSLPQNPMNVPPPNLPQNPMNISPNLLKNPLNVPLNLPQNPMNVPPNLHQNPMNVSPNLLQNPMNVPPNLPQNPINLPPNLPQNPMNVPPNLPQNPMNIPPNLPQNPLSMPPNLIHNSMTFSSNLPQNPLNLPSNLPQTPINLPPNFPQSAHRRLHI